jgi:hypothetical protein
MLVKESIVVLKFPEKKHSINEMILDATMKNKYDRDEDNTANQQNKKIAGTEVTKVVF